MAVITLAQAAQLEKQPLRKGVLLGLAQESIAADLLNFRDIGGRLSETGVRYDEVATPDWVSLGGTINSKSVNAKPIAFSVHKMAVHIDIPTELDDASEDQVARLFTQQVNMVIKGAAYQLNDALLNGDQSSDPNQPNGLVRLLADMDSRQRVGSTAIDLTGAYSDSVAESFFARIDRAAYAVDGHKPDFALANSDALLTMESWGRQYKMMGNNFNWIGSDLKVGDARRSQTTKATGPAFMYRGIPFYDIGLKADQTTKIIGGTYTEGGSTALATRFVFVKQGPEEFEALQFSPLKVFNVGGAENGALEDTDVRRKRITWTIGLAAWNPRCLSIAQGIQVNNNIS